MLKRDPFYAIFNLLNKKLYNVLDAAKISFPKPQKQIGIHKNNVSSIIFFSFI